MSSQWMLLQSAYHQSLIPTTLPLHHALRSNHWTTSLRISDRGREKGNLSRRYTLMHKGYKMQIKSKFGRCANHME